MVSVLGFGDNVVDKYEHIHTMYPGGNCVNFAVYAKMFGADRSAYMGYFGNDAEAEHVMHVLKEIGIEMTKCSQLEGPNGCARVKIENGDRIFLGSNGGGVRGENPYILDKEDLEYMKEFDVVHTGNYCFTEKELPKLKDAGILVSFDFSDDSELFYYAEVAPYADFAFCSFDGDVEEVKKHLKLVKALGPKIVCASRGEKGCMLYDGERFYEQKAVVLESVVDTMGAGDSLITSFLIGYLNLRKQKVAHEEAITKAIAEAATFAGKICQIEGAFGYGKTYE